jgi:hypothetical protein
MNLDALGPSELRRPSINPSARCRSRRSGSQQTTKGRCIIVDFDYIIIDAGAAGSVLAGRLFRGP